MISSQRCTDFPISLYSVKHFPCHFEFSKLRRNENDSVISFMLTDKSIKILLETFVAIDASLTFTSFLFPDHENTYGTNPVVCTCYVRVRIKHVQILYISVVCMKYLRIYCNSFKPSVFILVQYYQNFGNYLIVCLPSRHEND